MKKPHKHAELIHAYADGAEIQLQNSIGEWMDERYPTWNLSAVYRIKPEPKPDVVEHMSIYRNLNRRYENDRQVGESMHTAYVGNVQLTWDGETGKLKSAEVI